MSAVLGYSGYQRRVLAELGLAALRPRVATGTTADDGLQLRAERADDVLLLAILGWMPDGATIGQDGHVTLALPGQVSDDLGAVVDVAGLRRHPDWKRQLWQRQRRLRRGGVG